MRLVVFSTTKVATGRAPARSIIPKLHEALLRDMRSHDWPVTFSMGALSCPAPPYSLDQMLSAVDRMMYAVKRTGKNSVRFAVGMPTLELDRPAR